MRDPNQGSITFEQAGADASITAHDGASLPVPIQQAQQSLMVARREFYLDRPAEERPALIARLDKAKRVAVSAGFDQLARDCQRLLIDWKRAEGAANPAPPPAETGAKGGRGHKADKGCGPSPHPFSRHQRDVHRRLSAVPDDVVDATFRKAEAQHRVPTEREILKAGKAAKPSQMDEGEPLAVYVHTSTRRPYWKVRLHHTPSKWETAKLQRIGERYLAWIEEAHHRLLIDEAPVMRARSREDGVLGTRCFLLPNKLTLTLTESAFDPHYMLADPPPGEAEPPEADDAA